MRRRADYQNALAALAAGRSGRLSDQYRRDAVADHQGSGSARIGSGRHHDNNDDDHHDHSGQDQDHQDDRQDTDEYRTGHVDDDTYDVSHGVTVKMSFRVITHAMLVGTRTERMS